MPRRIAGTIVAIVAIIFGALSPARALPVALDSVQVGYTNDVANDLLDVIRELFGRLIGFL